MTSFAFAIPGDIRTLTGGYNYVLEGMPAAGHEVRHLELPAGFPKLWFTTRSASNPA